MNVDVVELPEPSALGDLSQRSVVVFDVLRASTTIVTALANGAAGVRVFESIAGARAAARSLSEAELGESVLCGEERALPPPGFALGNSPGSFTWEVVRGKTLLFATTNGTRALYRSRAAAELFVGAIVNASAVAQVLRHTNRDVTLVCAGTDGEAAPEDVIGAGAVIVALAQGSGDDVSREVVNLSDSSGRAVDLFMKHRSNLIDGLAIARGGQNLLRVGLGDDVTYCAQLDLFGVVPRVKTSHMMIGL